MFEQGLRNDSGNEVVKSRIHRLLCDPFYIGKISWNNEIHQGKHEPLIIEEIFYKVQSLLRSKNTPKYNKHNYRFKGLLKCAECNGTITWEIHKGIIYGHCNHYRNCSQKTWTTQNEVESQLIDEFGKLEIKNPRIVEWIRKALKESHKDQIAYYTSVISELNQKQELYRSRLDKLYEDKLDGKITEEVYNRKSKEWNGELEKITNTMEKHNRASGKYYQLGINIYELSQRARQIYLKAKKEEDKRALASLVFSRLTLDEGKLNIEHSKTFKLLAEAVKLTNGSKIQKTPKLDDRIFEPSKKPVISTKKDALYLQRPIWLPGLDSNQEPAD